MFFMFRSSPILGEYEPIEPCWTNIVQHGFCWAVPAAAQQDGFEEQLGVNHLGHFVGWPQTGWMGGLGFNGKKSMRGKR